MLCGKLVALLPLLSPLRAHLRLHLEGHTHIEHLKHLFRGGPVDVLHHSHRLLDVLEDKDGRPLEDPLEARHEFCRVLQVLEGVLDTLVEQLAALALIALLCKGILDLLDPLEVEGGAAHRAGWLGLLVRSHQPPLDAVEAERVAAARSQLRLSAVADGALHGVVLVAGCRTGPTGPLG